MGASESSHTISQKNPDDEITTISERTHGMDPILERFKSLKISKPILTTVPGESSLTDILIRKPSSSLNSGTVNPNVLLELFSMYRDWQEKKAQKIIKRQAYMHMKVVSSSFQTLRKILTAALEEIENKIEVADALAVKLLQRFNYSVSSMKTTSNHLSEVHALIVELGELKGRLTEVISNCDALCKRIGTEGPESLQSSIKPFTVDQEDQSPQQTS